MKFSRSLKQLAIGALAVLAVGEAAVRLAGITDFATYSVDNEIGYIPKPNQHGKFLNKNNWVFNDRSMGTPANWDPTGHANVLLLGNSIVMGGNPYDQKDKLGQQIQKNLGQNYSVWPIAAGGWTNVNEITYLDRNPEVLEHAQFFIWEFMRGGLSGSSHWRGEYVFPKEHPISALWYTFRRYALPRLVNLNMNELPPQGATDQTNLNRFEAKLRELCQATHRQHPGIIFLYPDKQQLQAARQGKEWLPDERATIERISHKYGLKIVDVSNSPEWTESMYREETHPTTEGNAVLAKILTIASQEILQKEPIK